MVSCHVEKPHGFRNPLHGVNHAVYVEALLYSLESVEALKDSVQPKCKHSRLYRVVLEQDYTGWFSIVRASFGRIPFSRVFSRYVRGEPQLGHTIITTWPLGHDPTTDIYRPFVL